MLRYFYIIVCIQVCFCSVYVDSNDYEMLDRRVRCKTTRLHKKQTRSPRKSRVVQFDVQSFMKTPEKQTEDILYGYRNKKRHNRLVSNNADFVDSQKSGKSIDAGYNLRSGLDKYQNPRHFNFHSHVFDDRNDVKLTQEHKKATSSFKNKLDDARVVSDPHKKCSFRNMKIPFFSRNKGTAKTKRHKKRKIFCFHCSKKTTTTSAPTSPSLVPPVLKTDDFNKDTTNIPSSDDKTNSRFKLSKVNKRDYGHLCPKCIKELLTNLKRKTTKKVHYSTPHSKSESKLTTRKRSEKQKADLSDSLEDEYYNVGSERLKRNEEEEQERERRLKELEEVEKKIENVHISATFSSNLPSKLNV